MRANELTGSMGNSTAHAFRGEFIDLCARVEVWAFETLSHPASQQKKMPHLFGQKLKAVTELVVGNPDIFAKPVRVSALIAEFQPFAALRSELAHALLTCAIVDGETIFAYANPSIGQLPSMTGRFWLSTNEAAKTLSDLRQLSKHICDQKLKLNPPLQPQPLPGATTGP